MQGNLYNPFISKKVYDALPDILKKVTENFSGREKDIVLTSALGVLSSVIPNVYGNYASNTAYPNLYTIFSAPPASGKGVMMKSRILAEKVHQKILEESLNQWNKMEDDSKPKEESKSRSNNAAIIKIVPANISSSELYSYMNKIDDGLLIIESEADTLSNMLGNDWSNYSDVLRKSFHHETISMSRKGDGLYINVSSPKLSIVLSGTPAQLKPLINSEENGLLSRFLVYYFDEINNFRNPFANSEIDVNKIFDEQAKEALKIYNALKDREEELEFVFTPRQQILFHKFFHIKQNSILNTTDTASSFVSSIHRMGLIVFRICMILSVYRSPNVLASIKELECSDADFILGLRLMNVYFEHSLSNFRNIEKYGFSQNDEELLASLPKNFTREEMLEIGEEFGIPKRTLDDKLRQWTAKKILIKEKRGQYKKP